MHRVIHTSAEHVAAPVLVSFLPLLERVAPSPEWWPPALHCEVEGPRWLLSVRQGS